MLRVSSESQAMLGVAALQHPLADPAGPPALHAGRVGECAKGVLGSGCFRCWHLCFSIRG